MIPSLDVTGRTICLCDINSAYVAMETVFRPEVAEKPCIVLSGNDGATIARGQLAKKMGIKMGQPWHELKGLHARGELEVFSSNFALYHCMSNRFNAVLRQHSPLCTEYSVDESWLVPPADNNLEPWGHALRADVLKKTGLPIGVGIGVSLTSAKLASWAAKTWARGTGNVVDVRLPGRLEKLLKLAPVREVWGIGGRLAARLEADHGVRTAWDLVCVERRLLRRHYGVLVESTARELCGEWCFSPDEGPEHQQQIRASQAFGRRIYDFDTIASAVASHVARAATKLRRQNASAQSIKVNISTSHFSRQGEPYSASAGTAFSTPLSDSRDLTQAALNILRHIYQEGPAYARAGVLLGDLTGDRYRCDDLFAPAERPGSRQVMSVVDQLNERMGRGTVRFGRETASPGWEMRQALLSPRYTTRWEDLPRAR